MKIDEILNALRAERSRLDAAITALEALDGGNGEVLPKRGRKPKSVSKANGGLYECDVLGCHAEPFKSSTALAIHKGRMHPTRAAAAGT